MKTRGRLGLMGLSLVMMTLLVACSGSPQGPAMAEEVEAAVKRAEAELAQAEAKGPPARKTGEVYASLP